MKPEVSVLLGLLELWKVRPLYRLKMSGTTHFVTWGQIPEKWRPHLHHCKWKSFTLTLFCAL